MVSKMEQRLIHLLRYEIELQKKLEIDYDADVPEGLQSLKKEEVELIENYYKTNTELQNATSRSREVLSLTKQCIYWDQSEKERKWFHF